MNAAPDTSDATRPAAAPRSAAAQPPVRHGPSPAAAHARRDGWSPKRQRTFLEAIAEGSTVGEACAHVGLSPASAYALRRRAAGASFRLGWDAANLLARDKVADTLLARAIEGQTETYTRGDAVFTRHRYDNRLATAMLARLDRLAEDAQGPVPQAARLVAQEFDAFLDLVERDEGPARTGLFVGARVAGDGVAWGDIDPVLALARADRYLRGHAGMAGEVDISDLDPARRAQWSADQWARADAAGLIVVADRAMDDPEFDDGHDDVDIEGEDDDLLPEGVDLREEDWETIRVRRAVFAHAAAAERKLEEDARASQLCQLRTAAEDDNAPWPAADARRADRPVGNDPPSCRPL